MARFKNADTTQTLLVPVRLVDQLIPGTSEHALHQIIEDHIDFRELSKRWFKNDSRGVPGSNPCCLLKWSGTFEELEGKKQKLRQRLKLMMDTHARQDSWEGRKGSGRQTEATFTQRLERQRKAIRRIGRFLATHEPKPAKVRAQRQSNITDNESAKLHSSHGMIQGYNALAMVDAKHQISVAAEPVGAINEGEHLEEVLAQAEDNARAAGISKQVLKGSTLVADTSYHSEENIKLCDRKGIDGYLPDPHFRSRDPRFPPANRRRKHKDQEQFRFNPCRNLYVCPNGKLLRISARKCRVKRFEGRRYPARKQDCQSCPLKSLCVQSKAQRRQLYIVDRIVGRDWPGEMRLKIDSAQGHRQYSRRMGIVEPVFANITTVKRLDRFTLRSPGTTRPPAG